jgi:nucleoside-diphosphate-sugar epimerase
MKRAAEGHTIGIFAASLKQIEAVDQNVEEGVRVIVDGALNSRRVAEEVGMKAACFISSDKSRAATTLYGAMKFVAGEAFIVNAEQSKVRLSTAVYGNVLNSTGSVIPLIWDAIKKGYSLKLYSPQMTRFMIDIEEAINLIEKGLQVTGYNIIPHLKAFKIQDLFEKVEDLRLSQNGYDIDTWDIMKKHLGTDIDTLGWDIDDLELLSQQQLNSLYREIESCYTFSYPNQATVNYKHYASFDIFDSDNRTQFPYCLIQVILYQVSLY